MRCSSLRSVSCAGCLVWFISFCSLLLQWQSVHAQQEEKKTKPKPKSSVKVKGHWIAGIEVSANDLHMIDKTFTGREFRAVYAGVGGVVAYAKPKTEFALRVNYAWGNSNDNGGMHQQYFTGDLTWLLRINNLKNKRFDFYAGGALNALYSNKNYNDFINNNSSFEFAASLAVAARLVYHFPSHVLRGVSIVEQFQIPLISVLQQPVLGSAQGSGFINQEGTDAQAFFHNTEWASFSGFVRLQNFLSIVKIYRQRHLFALHYNWDYWQIKSERQVIQANQQFSLSYRFVF